jgi:hypothetical protein
MSDAAAAVLAGVATKFCDNDTHSCPGPRVPWFGYLLFQRTVNPAAAGEDTISDGNPGSYAVITKAEATRACGANVKVWPVMHTSKDGRQEELRVAVLNKQIVQDCNVVIKVTGAYDEPAEVTRLLPGEKLLLAKAEVLFGGQRYLTLDGKLSGVRISEKVIGRKVRVEPRRRVGDKELIVGTEFVVIVPKASALVLVARKAADMTPVQVSLTASTSPPAKLLRHTASPAEATSARAPPVAALAAATRRAGAAAAALGRKAVAAMKVPRAAHTASAKVTKTKATARAAAAAAAPGKVTRLAKPPRA